ncbi:MAG: UDP-3-O-acyl-N-acetylglucosamine deacetylase, partial [Jaaginema sp. PMC 1078.18]|nr:UDP-3-O-acyl-N-acetylglucosamine deacetylase [Jaaginema sp. PMC 1078.18]
MPYTLQKPLECTGVGLHSGAEITARLVPETAKTGRYFVRTDLPQKPRIPANLATVHQTTLSTELKAEDATIRTVEHLLAALTALGVENVRIEVNGSEVPLLDGSAKPWVEAIASVGVTPDCAAYLKASSPLTEPITVYEKDAFVSAIPSPQLRFSYGIDFPNYAAIGQQWWSWLPSVEDFSSAIAPARTFGFADQIEQLRQAGLIQGGSLDNALVCDNERWLNPPLRFDCEPARHKMLDLLGDLSLLGSIPQAHYLAYKA